ncbi:MAG: acetate/propionate family kinase [Bacillota bacterium]
MLVLVLNCGSSSVKYKLYNMENEEVLISGQADRIGLSGSLIVHRKMGGEAITMEILMPGHRSAIEKILSLLTDPQYGAVSSVENISAVGHRVVHGGEKFSKSTLVTPEVLADLQILSDLAPLHNPPNITGINVCRQLIPGARQVAVFDTAFHQTMSAHAYLYGIPHEYYSRYGLRRYGFHGTSHRYVSMMAAKILQRPIEDLKLITCHLGNGSSVCAVKNGCSIDTSMGFTPLSGLIMGTRAGDLDPAIVSFLMEKEQMTPSQVRDLLNKKSGVLGISGISSDFRDLEKAAGEGNSRAQLALDMFCYTVRKWIGSFVAVIGGVDAIVFTAGIGENSPLIRSKILSGLSWLGIKPAVDGNVRGREAILTRREDPVQVLVVPTNEELLIARDSYELIRVSPS